MKKLITASLIATGLFAYTVGCATNNAQDMATPRGKINPDNYTITFDHDTPGQLPSGWQSGQTKPSAAQGTWAINDDGSNQVLSLTKVEKVEKPTYNVAWSNAAPFKDGKLSVKVRANEGVIDQGGGLIWRVIDADNYYIARYNPLETNLRVYTVVAGKRTQLQDSPDIHIPAGQWYTIEATHEGDHITVSLDGKQLLDVHDSTFPNAGGVGLWTKADAASSFDDLAVKSSGGKD